MARRWLVSIILVSFYLNSLFSFDIHDHNPEIRAAEIEFMQKDAKKPGTILVHNFSLHLSYLETPLTHVSEIWFSLSSALIGYYALGTVPAR